MRMPVGGGVPTAGTLTPTGSAVLSVAESFSCVGSIDDTVRERPMTQCCPHMVLMLRRRVRMVMRSRLPESAASRYLLAA
jgi:hypothetical protein